jgi:tellurite resistance protein
MLLMRGIAEASAAVASAGGVVREAGREAFRSAVRELFRPDESTGRYLDRCFDDAATRAGVVLLATFKEFCALEYRRLVLVVSLSVAKADGVVDASEAQVLRNLAELLGFDPNGVYEGIDPGAGTGVAEPWWELFNVPAKASLDAVVFAYRKLAMQFHPDIWAQAPETQRAVAAARMKSINAAFERAKLDIRARDKREKGAASASSNPAPAEAPKPKETALAGANSHNGHEDAPAAPADVSPAAATEQRPTKEDVPDESPTVGSTKSVSRRAVYYVLGVSLVALLGLFALDSFLRSGNETSDSPTRDRVAPTLHNPQPPAITSLETAGGSPPPRDEEMVQNGPAPRSLKDDQSNNHSYARREQIPADVSTPSATTDVGLATPEAVDARREASETYVAKGIVSFRGGNLEQAIIDMSEAIKIDANYPRAYFNRGCVWTLLGEYDIAIHDFDTTIALDPNFPRAAVHRDFAIQKKRETGGRPFRGRASSSP